MNAVEWLRAVAHRSDGEQVAVEAADALGWFAHEPAGLVVACRQLLAHHPESAPLWWLCSTVITAADPVEAAQTAGQELASDPTAEHLEAALPLLSGDQVVLVVGWPDAADRALGRRSDLQPVAIRSEGGHTARRVRRRSGDQRVRVIDSWEIDLVTPGQALVGAIAWGSGRALVTPGTGEFLDRLPARAASWLVGGIGRGLPERVLSVVEHSIGVSEEINAETVSLERFDRIVGPRGVESRVDAQRRVGCPIAPELLR